MELSFECPECRAVGTVAPVEMLSEVACTGCGAVRRIRREAFHNEALLSCPLCATEDLYRQKDFPQGLGLTIVVAGFAVSTYFWFYDRPVPALSVLLLSALADMALFYLVPDVTICYRCLSQFRGEGSNPLERFKPFDLAIGERYRQERLRIEQLRRRPASTEATSPPPS
jgi:hypothetical protein